MSKSLRKNSPHPGQPFTAYVENQQCLFMLNAYRYFTPMGSWISDARRIFFSSSASIYTRPRHPSYEEGHCTDIDPLRRWSTARWAGKSVAWHVISDGLPSAIARPFVVGVSTVLRRVPAGQRISNARDVETILSSSPRRPLSVAPTSTTRPDRTSLVSSVAALWVAVIWTTGIIIIIMYFIATKRQSEITQWPCAFNSKSQ